MDPRFRTEYLYRTPSFDVGVPSRPDSARPSPSMSAFGLGDNYSGRLPRPYLDIPGTPSGTSFDSSRFGSRQTPEISRPSSSRPSNQSSARASPSHGDLPSRSNSILAEARARPSRQASYRSDRLASNYDKQSYQRTDPEIDVLERQFAQGLPAK